MSADTAKLAHEALAAYGLPDDCELHLLKHRENSVFAFEHDGVDYVLRLHRQGYHSDAELHQELEFVRALETRGVRVPRFLPTVSGDHFTVVGRAHPAGLHQVDLQHFIVNDGNFGDEHSAFHGSAEVDPEDFGRLGELIAEVHNATVASGFSVEDGRPRWDAEGLVGGTALWGDPLLAVSTAPGCAETTRQTLAEATVLIRRTLDDYGQKPHRFGPIHADLTPENVLRTAEGLVLIDFDDFAAGWHLFDLATALYFYTRHPRAKDFHQALFAGYQKHRRLEAADFAAFPALLVARGLTYLGWAADRRGEPAAEFHLGEVLPHLLDLARTLLASSAASPDPSPDTTTASPDFSPDTTTASPDFSPDTTTASPDFSPDTTTASPDFSPDPATANPDSTGARE